MPRPGGGNGDFPSLGEPPNRTNGLYVVIQCKDEKKSLTEASPILVERTIKSVCGDVQLIKKTREGRILVLTKSEKQANQLMKITKVGNAEVSASEHSSKNICRVVISDRDLLYEEDSDIEKVLKLQGAVKVERIMRKTDKGLQKTPSVTVSFKATIPPTSVKIGYLVLQTRPYYPRPLRCFNCLQFGHIGKDCKTGKVCMKCGEAFHGEPCEAEEKCANCKESHNALSNRCVKYVEEMKVNKIKVDRNINYWEARKVVEAEQRRNYAEQVKKSTTDEQEKAARKREEEFKTITEEYEKRIQALEETIGKLHSNYQKALKKMTEEKTARKRAEKEYDDLSKWMRKAEENATQSSGSKHARTTSDNLNSPIRKKSCKKVDGEFYLMDSNDEDENNHEEML